MRVHEKRAKVQQNEAESRAMLVTKNEFVSLKIASGVNDQSLVWFTGLEILIVGLFPTFLMAMSKFVFQFVFLHEIWLKLLKCDEK